jgi:hypothetical protein
MDACPPFYIAKRFPVRPGQEHTLCSARVSWAGASKTDMDVQQKSGSMRERAASPVQGILFPEERAVNSRLDAAKEPAEALNPTWFYRLVSPRAADSVFHILE